MENSLLRQLKRAVLVAVLGSFLGVFPASASRKVYLQWAPAPDPEITGYVVYYGTQSGNYSQKEFADQPGVVISDLTERRTYFFTVTSVNSSGLESAPSAEVAYDVPALPSGSYHGLFYQNDGVRQESSGTVSLSLLPSGSYSGQLQRGAAKIPFSGKLNLQTYRVTRTLRPPFGRPLQMELNVGVGGMADEFYGFVSDGLWISGLAGDRAVYSKTNLAPYAGKYTMFMPGQEEDPALPMGHGSGSVIVSTGGTVRFAGALADGTAFSQSVPVAKQGEWPLFASLYSNKGVIIGWVNFLSTPESDLDGTLGWIKKPDGKAKFYRNGFAYNCPVVGSSFIAPPSSTNYVLSFTNGLLAFIGGNLDPGFTNVIALGTKGKVSSPGSPGFVMSFTMTNGVFSGKVPDPANSHVLRSFRGAVMQKLDGGFGYLLGTNQSSQVILSE